MQEKILNFDMDDHLKVLKKVEDSNSIGEAEKLRLVKSRSLVLAMQQMFARMLLSGVKYQNPIQVLQSIVDDRGDNISIFEQKDIGEFFSIFLERMQEGMGENKQLIRKLMGEDLVQEISLQKQGSTDNREQEVNKLFDLKFKADDPADSTQLFPSGLQGVNTAINEGSDEISTDPSSHRISEPQDKEARSTD